MKNVFATDAEFVCDNCYIHASVHWVMTPDGTNSKSENCTYLRGCGLLMKELTYGSTQFKWLLDGVFNRKTTFLCQTCLFTLQTACLILLCFPPLTFEHMQIKMGFACLFIYLLAFNSVSCRNKLLIFSAVFFC